MSKCLYVFGRYEESERLLGIEKFVKRFYQYYNNDMPKAVFIDFFFGYSLSQIVNKIIGCRILKKDSNKKYVRAGFYKIIKMFFQNEPQKILITRLDTYIVLIALFAKIFFRTKLFYTLHGVYKYERKIQNDINENKYLKWKLLFSEYIIIKMTDIFFVFSNESIDILNKNYNVVNKKCYIIEHGIDKSFFYKKEQTNKNGILKIIYTGGFGKKIKNFDLLADIINRIEFDLQLTICGRTVNNCQEECLNKIKNKNVKILNKGFLETKELAAEFRVNDIFILTSCFETFSITTLEAMASSLTPIVTLETGISRTIINTRNGFKFSYLDKKSFVRVLNELNKNRELLDKISLEAQKESIEYTWDKKINKITELINT